MRVYRTAPLAPAPLGEGEAGENLVAHLPARGPSRFRAVRTAAEVGPGGVRLPREAVAALGARPGEPLHLVPFDLP